MRDSSIHSFIHSLICCPQAAIDKVLSKLRGNLALLKSTKSFQTKRSAGEIKKKDAHNALQAFVAWEGQQDN